MELLVSNRQKLKKISSVLVKRIIRILRDNLDCRIDDVSVLFVDDEFITSLNRVHFSKDNPTDVISFPYTDYSVDNVVSGEIVISVERALAQHSRYRTTLADEICRYVVHGFLHLLGYADVPECERVRMKKKENALLRFLHDQSFPFDQLI